MPESDNTIRILPDYTASPYLLLEQIPDAIPYVIADPPTKRDIDEVEKLLKFFMESVKKAVVFFENSTRETVEEYVTDDLFERAAILFCKN